MLGRPAEPALGLKLTKLSGAVCPGMPARTLMEQLGLLTQSTREWELASLVG